MARVEVSRLLRGTAVLVSLCVGVAGPRFCCPETLTEPQSTEINQCNTDQADGEGSAANRGAVRDEDRKLEKQVGYPVTYKGNRDRTNQNKRTDDAPRTVARIARLPKGFGPVRGSLKRMQSPGTNLPSSAGCRASNPKVRSRHK